jgi:hypothetical protein
MYATTDAATKVRKALHRWLKQIRDTGVEPLIAEQRPAELSAAQKWRGEIARLRGMSAAKADEFFLWLVTNRLICCCITHHGKFGHCVRKRLY